MAFGTFSPGSYAVTWNGNALGYLTRPARIRRASSVQPITVDLYGDSLVDGVYRGGRVFAMLEFAEWTANLRAALWPYSADLGATGLHGRLQSDIAAAMVLTPTASTPAATLGSNTFTASKAILAPQNNVEFLLGNIHRDIPVAFEWLMYLDVGTPRFFTLS